MRVIPALLLFVSLGAAAQDLGTLLGAGLRSRPEYDGSRERTVDVIPVVRYYGPTAFARTTQGILEGGARKDFGSGLVAGVQLAYEAGPLGHDPGVSAGLHVEWDWKNVTLLARTRNHLDSHRGTAVDGRFTVGILRSGGLLAGVFAQATWANASNHEEYYGIDNAGLQTTRLGLLASYTLSPAWVLVGGLERGRVMGDASRSPVVQRQAAAMASIGLARRF
jgi:outer membrane scaffolding protein for murein synthesis (MipA/OmpV family)